MRTGWAVAFGVVIGLLVGGVIFLASRPPQGASIPLRPPPTPAPLVIQVNGAVQHPGVYRLPQGSRVQEAIEAAGGVSSSANPFSLNLAAPLQDGQQISVPGATDLITPMPSAGPVQSSIDNTAQATQAGLSQTSGLININTASQAELDGLPGIGLVLAQRIIAYRQEHGPFTSIEAIQAVSGIGPATFQKIKDRITVTGNP